MNRVPFQRQNMNSSIDQDARVASAISHRAPRFIANACPPVISRSSPKATRARRTGVTHCRPADWLADTLFGKGLNRG